MPDRELQFSNCRKCRSCQAEVMFIPSASTGNYMILNAEPDERGNIEIIDGKAVLVDRGGLLETLEPGAHYLDHHVTCPQARAWKEAKKKSSKDAP